jgi:zinc transport system ATP-binding protein
MQLACNWRIIQATVTCDPIVDIAHLDFAYADQLVLSDIDLSVTPASTLGLIGPNGGGKTTLLRLMLGLLEPTRGRITVAGMDPRRAVRRGDLVGYLPQRPHVPRNFPINVRQLARLGLAGKTGVLRRAQRADLLFVDQLIERVGMRDLAVTPVPELSGGQLQRALIARALAPRPKLLLLDEPTTGVDRAGQQKFVELLTDLRGAVAGLTVLLISHDLRAVTSVCDRIACLNVTLHYHDVPHRVPADLIRGMFACDLEAMGLGRPHAHEPHPQPA